VDRHRGRDRAGPGRADPRRTAITTSAGLAVRRILRDGLLHHVMALGPEWASKSRLGAAQATIVEGVDGLDPYYSEYLPQLAVTVTLPAELTEITWYGDPHSRVKPHFYKGAGDCGLLDINVDHFRFESAQTSAFDEWEAYRRDCPDVTSTIVALDWPGAEGAWAWTWDQPADASILSDSATGTVNLSGVCMMLRSTSGQDVYIAAYAPRGGLQGCPALRALDSLTLG